MGRENPRPPPSTPCPASFCQPHAVEAPMFSCQLPAVGIHKPTPITPTASSYQGNMFGSNQMGYCYGQAEEPAVLDLRVCKGVQDDPVTGQLTPPRDEHCTSPPLSLVSPTLAITQRVLAAASQPQGTRPFKAYPKDPLSLGSTHDEAYMKFRDEMLSQVRGAKGGGCPRKQPGSPNNQPQSGGESDEKDAAYWERRRKNNEAAKRSRDARRAKEDEIAIRAAFLEQENLKLKYQIAAITEEYNHMRRIFYESRHHHHHTLQPIL